MPTRLHRFLHFVETDLRAWQSCVLILSGFLIASAGLDDLRLSRCSTAVAAPATLEELESPGLKNFHRVLGRHVPVKLMVLVVRNADSKRFDYVYYPVVSQAVWNRAVDEAQARHPDKDTLLQEVYPLLKFQTVVRTKRFAVAADLKSVPTPTEGLTGLVVGDQEERARFAKALDFMKSLSEVYRAYPAYDGTRLLVFEEGRTPRPLAMAAAETAAGLLMSLMGIVFLLASPARRLSKRFSDSGPTLSPPPPVAPGASRRGARLWLAAFMAALAGSVFCIWLMGRADSEESDGIIGVAGIFSLFLVAAPTARRRARRHEAAAAQSRLAQDPRPPVLYLRSFSADMSTAEDPHRSFLPLLLIQPGRWIAVALSAGLTEEEYLAQALGGIGPVVAIGRPGEPLPELGAVRVYAAQDEWQAKVAEYMRTSKLVVLRLGATQGFRWEFQRSARDLDPTRLVLLVPFDRKTYDRFRAESAELFPHPLPEYEEKWFGVRRGLGTLHALIYFESGWKPRFVDLAQAKPDWAHFLRYVGQGKLLARLNWALRPVYAQAGAAWAPPPIPLRFRAYAAALALLARWIAVMFLIDPRF